MDLFKTWLVETPIAHRGLHGKNVPENSLLAFSKAIEKGYAISFEVQMLADGTLAVFNDSSLSRMTGNDGYVHYLNCADLKALTLKDSKETIPTLQEVLSLVDGQVPVLVEIKNKYKVGKVEQRVIDVLKNYKGEFAVQSFNPNSIKYIREHAPNFVRGQISGFFNDENAEGLSALKKFSLKRMIPNKKISKPHFISYQASTLPNRFVRKYKDLPLLAWTVRSKEEYLRVIKYCDNIVFEKFEPEI